MSARRASRDIAAVAGKLPSDVIATFGPRLVAWQRKHGRHALPWQQTGPVRDPYRVWLAEVMLQQTTVAAVVPFYRRFVGRFPDVASLAAASIDDVMQVWSGLGYYSRARNLHRAARIVVDRHGGRFPDERDAIEALPGVGRSTAAAIAAFAFGRRGAILDGNVKRVLVRLFAIEGEPSSTATTAELWSIAEALAPERDIERYTQGMMDLGATVCLPRRPLCLLCPFASDCVARRTGRVDDLPMRRARKAMPVRSATLLLATRGDAVFLERRPPTGIWGGLWSLPECEDDADAASRRVAGDGSIESCRRERGFTHAFTHFSLEADLVRVRLSAGSDAGRRSANEEGRRWVAHGEWPALGMPTPIRRLLSSLALRVDDGPAASGGDPVDPPTMRMAARE